MKLIRTAQNGLTKMSGDYEIYHDTYTSAVQEANRLAERRGFNISEETWWNEIATGPGRPKDGEQTKHTLPLEKDGKLQKKALYIQVYNRGTDKNTYELNAYIF